MGSSRVSLCFCLYLAIEAHHIVGLPFCAHLAFVILARSWALTLPPLLLLFSSRSGLLFTNSPCSSSVCDGRERRAWQGSDARRGKGQHPTGAFFLGAGGLDGGRGFKTAETRAGAPSGKLSWRLSGRLSGRRSGRQRRAPRRSGRQRRTRRRSGRPGYEYDRHCQRHGIGRPTCRRHWE